MHDGLLQIACIILLTQPDFFFYHLALPGSLISCTQLTQGNSLGRDMLRPGRGYLPWFPLTFNGHQQTPHRLRQPNTSPVSFIADAQPA